MNDQELLELVQSKTPEELTLEEIFQLRQGIGRSPELRETLSNQMQMEQYLGEALGRTHISVDTIIAGSAGMAMAPAAGSTFLNWMLGGIVTSILASVLVVAVVVPPSEQKKIEDIEVETPEPKTTETPASRPEELDPSLKLPSPSPSDDLPPRNTPADDTGKPDPKANADPNADPNEGQPKSDPQAEAAAAWKARQEANPFVDVAFNDFAEFDGTDFGSLQSDKSSAEDKLKELFDRKDGRTFDHGRFWAGFEGLHRFKPAWGENAVLRLAVFEDNNFRIHFWNGKRGVTLIHYRHNESWAAYGTTREKNDPRPATFALWDVDDDVYRRTMRGTIEIRHQDGQLIVSRGDAILLNAPLAGAPAEIFFEGRGVFRGIDLFPGAPLPAAAPQRPLALRTTEPAQLNWNKHVPEGAEIKQHADGRVELRADKSKDHAWAGTPLDLNLREVILLVEDPQPGTGIYVGDAGGPKFNLGFFREGRTKQVSFGYIWPGDGRRDSNHPLEQTPAPLVHQQQWIRLVAGPGIFKCWTSGDGKHWGRIPFEPHRVPTEGWNQVGLYCVSGDGDARSIKLRQVEVRRFDAIEALAPAEVRQRALALAVSLNSGEWLAEVLAQQPKDVDAATWIRACAVVTLAAGPNPALGTDLLWGLADDVIEMPWSAERRLQALDQIATVMNTWDHPPAEQLLNVYTRLGRQLFREGESRAYSKVAASMATAPIWTHHLLQVMPEPLVRDELLGLVYDEKWNEVRQLSQRINTWSHSSQPRSGVPNELKNTAELVEWAYTLAMTQWVGDKQRLANRGMESVTMPNSWRHPLIERLSKEGYNVLAEFEAALKGQAFDDACRIITSSSAHGALGLLPEGKDPQLLVSLPGAVALAMRESPGLKSTMRQKFQQVGLLRVRQAIAEGNALDVQAATVQFYGTEAAAEAHLWLGDRALSSGDFARAFGHYQQLLDSGSAARRTDTHARLRLAGAMMGREVGHPVTASVQFGGTQLSPNEFEAMIRDLRETHEGRASRSARQVAVLGRQQTPAPSRFDLKQWGRFSGNPGQGPGSPPARNIDWAGRQISVTLLDNLMLVNNRFEVTAFDLSNGKLRWNRQASGAGRAHDWSSVAMQPVVAGDHIYTRFLTNQGPELVCLALEDGKVLWRNRPGDFVASDPLVVQDELFALCGSEHQNRVIEIYFTSFDPENGQVLSKRPLMQLRDVWDRQVPCEVVRMNDRIVGTLGSTVFCTNLLGESVWLRRQTYLPQSQDEQWFQQRSEPPIVTDNKVIVSQPGVRSVECLDLETGRLQWRRTVPDMEGLVGLLDGRVVIETLSGFMAVELKSGRNLWFHQAEDHLHAQSLGEPGGLLYSRKEQVRQDRWQVLLVWVDPATGRETARLPLEQFADKEPMLGPLVGDKDRLWVFHARGMREPHRDIWQLDAGEKLPSVHDASILEGWASSLQDEMRLAAAPQFPGWSLIECARASNLGRRDDWRGTKDVFVTSTIAEQPARFARQLAIPNGARLKLRVGYEGGHGECVVRIGRQEFPQVLDDKTVKDGWCEWEVDLAEFAGRREWIIVEHRVKQSDRSTGFWDKLEVTVGK